MSWKTAVFVGIAAQLSLPGDVSAQRRTIHFSQLSIEQGLSQASVNCILQDRWGFMWFGTQDGLNRYDGYNFTVFRHEPLDSSSLAQNWVSAVLEDRRGTLWVGTRGGLDRFDATRETFHHFTHDPSQAGSLGNDHVRSIYEDRKGNLWVGTEGGGLDKLDASTGAFTHYRHDPQDPKSLSHDAVAAILEDRQGSLWFGTEGGGLNRLEPSTGIVTHYRHDPGDPRSLSDDRVRTLYEDRDGVLWVGTREGGIDAFDRAGGRFVHHRHRPSDPASLSANSVAAIYQDQSGVLWVGTDGGLNEWNPADRTFVRHRSDPMDPGSLSDDQVRSLYADKGGVLWVGTFAGLNKWNTRIEGFRSFRAGPRGSGLSTGSVGPLQADRQGVLWIGTFGGLNRFDPRTGSFSYYRHQDSDPRSLIDDRVNSLLVDKEGTLWVGTFASGLDRFDGTAFTHYRHDPSDPSSLSGNVVSSLCEDTDGVLWVATYGAGLNRFDRAKGGFVRYRSDPSRRSGSNQDRIQVIYQDREGFLWVGTDGGGLGRFNRHQGSFTWFRHDPKEATSLSSDWVSSIHEDASGVLWIGTDAGLVRWDPADRRANRARFQKFGAREGLPNEVVYGILSDRGGDLWLSTVKGLSRFNPTNKSFKNYNPSHGLQSWEFNLGAYYQSPDGEMFFGGVNGFNSFHPDRIRGNTYVPPIVVTGFWKSGQKVALDRPLWETEEIELSYRDYVVSFEFAALDYTAPEQNRYGYKLDGLDEDWIDLGTLRRATYTNLAPGRYAFRVRGSNNDGVWSDDGAVLRIRVIPPPWRTWWAYLSYVLALAGVVLGYVQAQARKLAREEEYGRKLAQQVQQRTRELEERTQQLAESNQELQVANQKLEEAALTDPVTGLKNRRYLMTQIQEELALVERHHAALQDTSERRRSLVPDFIFVMIDLDGFKEVNDVYGHGAGDLVLIQVCELLRGACRKSDTIIRWGGDEFMVVGRGADPEHAEVLAERVRLAIEQHHYDVGAEQRIHLSSSIGFAFYPFLYSRTTLLKGTQVLTIADRALYVAKSSGRNAWVGIYSTDMTPEQDLPRLINEELANLVREGAVEVRTSIRDRERLVWDRQ